MRRITLGQNTLCTLLIITVMMTSAYAAPARAQAIALYTNVPGDIEVTVGGQTYVVRRGLSISITGGTVCVLTNPVYVERDVRYVFKYWLLNGRVVSSDNCASVKGGGDLLAFFRPEYRVRVVSDPVGVVSYSTWVEGGVVFNITVPEEVSEGNVVYRFAGWEGPLFSPNNTVSTAVASPTVFTARYVRLFPLWLEGPGGRRLLSLVRERGQYVVFLNRTIDEDGYRLVLEDVVVAGSSYTLAGKSRTVLVLTVTSPTTIYTYYSKNYPVTVVLPTGSSVFWAREGETFTLDAPEVIPVEDDVRLVFKQWSGGVSADVPKYAFKVTGPVRAVATYERQYRALVYSPLGQDIKWVAEGGRLIVYLPPELPGLFTNRVLTGFLVEGGLREPAKPGLLMVENVSSPLEVDAIYETRIAWFNVLVFVALILAISASYILYTYLKYGRGEEKAPGKGGG